MALTAYAYSLEKRQEQFSAAYVRAIASASGYKVTPLNSMDEDSEDIQIHQKRNDLSDDRPYYSVLRVQLKCTSHRIKDDGFIHYRIPLKTHDDLRRKTGDPFLLVVVCVPSREESDWLLEERNHMVLYNKAYWLSLRGEERIPENTTPRNKRKVTVRIPTSQMLDVKGLTAIMDDLANGVFPK